MEEKTKKEVLLSDRVTFEFRQNTSVLSQRTNFAIWPLDLSVSYQTKIKNQVSGLRDNKSFILVKPNQIARFKSLLVQEQSLCFSIWDRRSRARAFKKTAGAALVAPRQSWILESTLWNPDSFWIPCPEQGFRIPIVSGIPDPKSWNTDSKAQHSGFHKHNFFEIPDSTSKNFPDSR